MELHRSWAFPGPGPEIHRYSLETACANGLGHVRHRTARMRHRRHSDNGSGGREQREAAEITEQTRDASSEETGEDESQVAQAGTAPPGRSRAGHFRIYLR